MIGANEREMYNIEALVEHADPDTLFLDIGAHVGYFALRMSNYFKHVYAFEPDIFNYEGLLSNIVRNKLLKKVTAYNIAISDIECSMDVESKGASSRMIAGDTIAVRNIDNMGMTENIGAIEIDTEGFEMNVLRGAEQTIMNHKPMLLIKTHQYSTGTKNQIADIIRWLEDHSYNWKPLFIAENGDQHLIATPK